MEGDEDFLLKKEEPRLIEELKPEYNATFGGEGVLGYKHTEKTKEIMLRLESRKKRAKSRWLATFGKKTSNDDKDD